MVCLGIMVKETAWRESDVIDADVSPSISAHAALKHDLEVLFGEKGYFLSDPVVALIPSEVEEEGEGGLCDHIHTQSASALTRHMQVKHHLQQ